MALATVLVADATFNVISTQWVKDDLDHLRLPEDLRYAFPVIKSASAVGLLAGLRWPRLGRLTAAMLIAYFLAAMGAHARVKDRPRRYMPAMAMLAWSTAALGSYPTARR